jgi:hypothetical protein
MFVFGATVAGPLLAIETLAWAAATLMLQLLVAVPDAESLTLLTNEEVPAAVGVPIRSPVDGIRVKPGGSDAGVGVIENV